jgi:hypothetical protein
MSLLNTLALFGGGAVGTGSSGVLQDLLDAIWLAEPKAQRAEKVAKANFGRATEATMLTDRLNQRQQEKMWGKESELAQRAFQNQSSLNAQIHGFNKETMLQQAIAGLMQQGVAGQFGLAQSMAAAPLPDLGGGMVNAIRQHVQMNNYASPNPD